MPMILDSGPDVEKWVIQRRVYQHENKCSWKTIAGPADFESAMRILTLLPIETSRLLSDVEEFFVIGSIQREEI